MLTDGKSNQDELDFDAAALHEGTFLSHLTAISQRPHFSAKFCAISRRIGAARDSKSAFHIANKQGTTIAVINTAGAKTEVARFSPMVVLRSIFKLPD